MLSLKDKDWEEFYIVDYFTPQRGREGNMTGLSSGDVPLISAKKTDNGLKAFVNAPIERLHLGHVITLNNDGDGGAGLAYFQPFSFALDTHVTTLRPIAPLSKQALIFISAAISKQSEKFGHGHAISNSRLKKMKMMLPINKEGEPDFTYMADYVSMQEQLLVCKYATRANEMLDEIGDVECKLPLKEKEWKPFRFNEIFGEIRRGKRLKKADHLKGEQPYVSSSASNNGVDAFVSNTHKVRKFRNCITIANSGSVGKAFFHQYEFVASDHVTQLKNPAFNRYIYLFLVPVVSRLAEKYSFNREINDIRINKEIILLPVCDSGKPDWEYMERYAKAITRNQLKTYLNHIS